MVAGRQELIAVDLPNKRALPNCWQSRANKPAPRFESIGKDDKEAVLHRRLAYFNRRRLSPELPHADWRASLGEEQRMKAIEGEFVESERFTIRPKLDGIPTDAARFVDWFEELKRVGPGQGDALFPWLAQDASKEQLRWFLHQEVAGEAGFEDLVAMTQVKMPESAKLELARNYWDEMGRGNASGMHGPMLAPLADEFALTPTPETTVWQSLALGNLMVALAATRRYAYQSIGALGAIELTAPTRAGYVAQALRRVGMDGKARVYFELHATLDLRHSEAWNREVIYNLVAQNPATAEPIAEGALLRLQAGARCFDRYRRAFSLGHKR
jgi:hypothetical protein